MRRLVHLVLTFAVAALLALPMLLGPGAGWALRALGGAPEHRCACGMTQGKCGCPECARVEHERAAARAPSRVCTLRSTCNDDDAPIASAALPAATIAARDIATPPRPDLRPVSSPRVDPVSRLRKEPPTPPPRSIVV